MRVAEEHIRLNPDDARALYIGANGLVSLGRFEEGLKWASLARELQPNEPMALYNLACIYSLAGDHVKMIEHDDASSTEEDGVTSWNLISKNNQDTVSGVYMFHVKDDDTGQEKIGKFVIIR